MPRPSKGERTPGSGRKPGVSNKKTIEAESIAERLGCNPLEVLINFAKGDWKALGYDSEVYHMEKPDGSVKMGFVITPDQRITAASQACKYIYPQKKTVEVSADPDKGLKLIIEDYSSK